MSHRVQAEIGGRTLTIETGVIARQAQGSVTVRYGDTVVLVTVCATKEPVQGRDFLPLTVEYREKAYAAGKIPGGYFKREGRPTEKEILSARIIDRSIRPLFPKGYRNEIQLIATILSADQQNYPNILALIGASAALNISPIPFAKIIAGVRVGRIEGQYVINPTSPQFAESDLDITIAMSRDSILMVEGGAKEADEAAMVGGLKFGHAEGQQVVGMIEELVKAAGVEKWPFTLAEKNPDLEAAVREITMSRISEANRTVEKAARRALYATIETEAAAAVADKFPDAEDAVGNIVHDLDARGHPQDDRRAKRPHRRPPHRRDPGDQLLGGRAAAHARLVALHARRDAGARRRHARHRDRRAARRRPRGRRTRSRTCCTTTSRRSPSARCAPIRGTSRREIGHGALAERAIEPVHSAGRRASRTRSASSPTSSSRTARRRWRRSAAARSRSWTPASRSRPRSPESRWGSIKEGRAVARPLRHPRRRGSPRRHGLQGRRHGAGHHRLPDGHQDRRRRRSRSWSDALGQARAGRLHILGIMNGEHAGAARGALDVRAAHHRDPHRPGEDPRDHRPRRQDDPQDHRGDRAQYRRRGRRHGARSRRSARSRAARRS